MRTPESDSIALGWLSPERVAQDYGLISAYIGLDKPFDPQSAFTNEFLSKEIKLPK